MPKKILLADDSITIQKVVTLTLSPEDYELVIVGDGTSAMDKAKKIKPDLIIADIAMPGKNGYEVCEFVKKDPELMDTPLLLLSGAFETIDRAEAERVGADDYIVKPFESEELVNKVRELLSRPPRRAPEKEEPVEAPPLEERPPVSEEIWLESDFVNADKKEETVLSEAGALEGEFLDLGFGEEEPPKEPAVEPEGKPGKPGLPGEEDYLEEAPILEILEEEEKAELPAPEELTPEKLTDELTVEELTAARAEPPFVEAGVEEGFKPSFEAFKMPEVLRLAKEPEEAVFAPEEKEAGVKRPPEKKAERPETLPREDIERIVAKVAREVIEEIAWEVVPDVAEDVIRKEFIERVRQAMTRPK